MIFKLEDVRYLRAPPSIDALIIIADHTDVRRLPAGQAGNEFELQAIGAAVIGGASLFGGEGNPLGSLIGALTLGAMQNGLTLMNVPSFWQFVATSAVVILAVFVDQATRKRQ